MIDVLFFKTTTKNPKKTYNICCSLKALMLEFAKICKADK